MNSALDGRRVLVTGGAGFIGSHLVDELLRRDCTVTVVDDLSTGTAAHLGLPRDGLRFVHHEVAAWSQLEQAAAEHDLIFHLASSVGVELVLRDAWSAMTRTIDCARAVLDAAARCGTTVLLTSTSEIYGKNDRVPLSEDADRVLGPTSRERWSYSTAKAVIETQAQSVLSSGRARVIVCRLFNTIGPRQTGRYGMVVPRFVAQAMAGARLQVFGDGEQTRSFCDVADTVAALIALVQTDRLGDHHVFNVGGTREVTIRKLARDVLRVCGREPEAFDLVPYNRAYNGSFEDQRRRVPDISRIRRVTGWQPRIELEETIGKVASALATSVET